MGKLVAWGQLRNSNRDDSDISDVLIDFCQQQKWKKQLLEIAEYCSKQTITDWNTYAKAFDDGVFGV